MQRVVFDEPYEFVPPVYSDWWSHILRFYVRHHLRKVYGVQSIESRHVERLKKSLAAGRSIMLAPNHCRLSDPMVLGVMALEAGTYLHAMASWHLFKQSRFQTFMIRRMGAFSVLREGNDRKALDTAIDILVSRRRPLIMFPEGAITRHNDIVNEMMEGPSFMARQAAKRLKKQGSSREVVIHPVAIRYSFTGDLAKSLNPSLDELETRLSWQPQHQLTLVKRVGKIGDALLSLKEIEYLGATQSGDPYDRAEHFIESVLSKVESEWQQKDTSGGVIARVKRLRTVILADMVAGKVSAEERQRRWHQLAAIYYAQQISHYPRDYILPEKNLPERVVETVERLEEDFVDLSHKYEPFQAVVEVGEAIPVGPERERGAEGDPIMEEVRRQLQTMIDGLAAERKPV
jgi:1-acyl-sn-glycerol-3-phosphate acyltransferase